MIQMKFGSFSFLHTLDLIWSQKLNVLQFYCNFTENWHNEKSSNENQY